MLAYLHIPDDLETYALDDEYIFEFAVEPIDESFERIQQSWDAYTHTSNNTTHYTYTHQGAKNESSN